ncbi:MAG: hypothetical protein ACREX9_04540 [Gammaproteobacteria bacterium]
MKEIKAHSREEKLDAVVRALRAAGARAVTAVRVVPLGSEVEQPYGPSAPQHGGDGGELKAARRVAQDRGRLLVLRLGARVAQAAAQLAVAGGAAGDLG